MKLVDNPSKSPTHTLQSQLKRPMVTGIAKIWHYGLHYTWLPVYGTWVKDIHTQAASIRPGEMIPDNVAVFDE